MINTRPTLPVLLAVTLLAAGCGGDTSSSQGRVAILDLKKVATAIGWDLKINIELRSTEQKLDQGLKQVQTKINTDLQQKRAALGDTPTDEQKADFIKDQQAAQQRFNEALDNRDSLIRRTQAQLLGEFRDTVKPFASRVADAMGFKIVMASTDSVLTVDSRSDITDAVIAAMLQAGKKYTPPVTSETPTTQTPTPAPGGQPGETTPAPAPVAPNTITPPATPGESDTTPKP